MPRRNYRAGAHWIDFDDSLDLVDCLPAFQSGRTHTLRHSQSISVGTIIRLSADMLVLAVGYGLGDVQGIVVARWQYQQV